jgi:predicted NACHT family NTPase
MTMNRRAIRRIVLVAVFFIVTVLLCAQTRDSVQKKDSQRSVELKPDKKETVKQEKEKESDIRFWIPIVTALFAGLIGGGGLVALIQYIKRLKIAESERRTVLKVDEKYSEERQVMAGSSAKEKYAAVLRRELGFIDLLGSPDIESKTVNLDDAFVSLRISESWRCEDRFGEMKKQEKMPAYREGRYLTPEEVIKRAFQEYKLLLVIGDPGSGKTTLMKYYAVGCLDRKKEKCRQFGFTGEILPIYFPLRELEFDEEDEPSSLPENLAKWTDKRLLCIPAEQFLSWLQEERTLVMLDGLDEISSMERRQNVCRWIETMSTGLLKACFVVTSRSTGYRKLDGIELEIPHLRADIMDFTPRQQADFLKKWFRAVFLAEMPPKDERHPGDQWKQLQVQRADLQSGTIISFLESEDNKAVQDLAAVPMLLQIMAIIWKDREHLPESGLPGQAKKIKAPAPGGKSADRFDCRGFMDAGKTKKRRSL